MSIENDRMIKARPHSINAVKSTASHHAFDNCIRTYKSSPGGATVQLRHFGQMPKSTNQYTSKAKPDRHLLSMSIKLDRQQLIELRDNLSLLLDTEPWS